MQLDWQTIATLFLLPSLGFFLKGLHRDVMQTKSDITALQVQLPTYYVQKAELKDVLERMYGELVEIKQELRTKEDKQ